MGLVRTQAILLRKWDYSESSLIVSFLTHDHGRLQFLIKGAKKPAGRFQGAFDHGACYEIAYNYRPGHRGLTLLRESKVLDAFLEIRGDLRRFYHLAYCLELAGALTEPEEADPELFDLLLWTAGVLRKEDRVDLVVSAFEMRILRHAGLLPDPSRCAACQRPFLDKVFMNSLTGAVYCGVCRSTALERVFDWEDLRWLGEIAQGRFSGVPGQAAGRIGSFVRFCVDLNLTKPLKSRKFL